MPLSRPEIAVLIIAIILGGAQVTMRYLMNRRIERIRTEMAPKLQEIQEMTAVLEYLRATG